MDQELMDQELTLDLFLKKEFDMGRGSKQLGEKHDSAASISNRNQGTT